MSVQARVRALCLELGLLPELVARLELTPRQVVATVFKTNAEGRKYLLEDGEPLSRR